MHPSCKNELYYIIEADKNSKVLGGVILKEYHVKKGMWVYMPAGTVHTIIPPTVLLEVSQNHFITYRLYDWGRKRGRLDVRKGLEIIKPKSKPLVYKNNDSFQCPYFKTKILKLRTGKVKHKKLSVYFVLKGRVVIKKMLVNILRKIIYLQIKVILF